ncbi:hypothetical protein TSUD_276490 [Trifolium subterraneum]|uniref:Uncharacterized protein n=1 Tax=Trifolium subterraneum TaxID=3900 RepID=A0A2Z6P787_TRISU|nr:hypothetical protein TSUD_276490 [Trifolium subterraneum]
MTSSNDYESVPYSVVSSLLNNLNNLISLTDFGKTYGVADLLKNILSNIEKMNSNLPEVERKKNETDILQWLRRSKPLLLAADDLFDDIAAENLLLPNPRLNFKRKVRRFFSSSNLFVYRSQIARELMEAKKNVNDIVEGMRQLKLGQGHEIPLREISTKESFKEELDLLHQNLSGTRYLLVLDNVRNATREKWADLASYLVCGAHGSKILFTTRSEMVAHVMDATPYCLEGLTDKESSILLEELVRPKYHTQMIILLIFFGVSIPYGVVEEISKKCAGHPLTIRCMAAMLCSKPQDDWDRISKQDIWKMEFSSNMNIFPVLRISYDNLSNQLKECLSYCSLYPKGREIEKNELIQSWMAQGYLQCLNGEQQMEDLGNEFVNTLLSMSFFVPGIDIDFDPPRRDIKHVHMSLPMKSYNNIGLSVSIDLNDKKKKAAKLNELQNLNSLRGNLEINVLDQWRLPLHQHSSSLWRGSS